MKISEKNYEGNNTVRETILTDEKAPAYNGASEQVEGPFKKWSKFVLQVLLATVVTGGITIVSEPQLRI